MGMKCMESLKQVQTEKEECVLVDGKTEEYQANQFSSLRDLSFSSTKGEICL